MASAMRVFSKFRSSDGRIKAATAIGVLALVSAVAAFGILPALANHEADVGLTALVDPDPLEYGGGSGGCAAAGSVAEHELWINNPVPGKTSYEGPDPDKTVFTLTVTEDDFYFDFDVEQGSSMGVFDVTVNGGKKSLHYDYDGKPHLDDGKMHPEAADDNLHAPTKGQNLYNLSHVNICYDVRPPADVSGVKYHDRDTDGTQDASEELGLEGWTITAFDSEGVAVETTTTGPNGSYTLTLVPGDYLICEATNSTNLPADGTGFTWSWAQSQPAATDAADCSNAVGHETLGYAITVDGDETGLDFGNHRQVTVTCGSEDVRVTLGEEGQPTSTVTFPAGCTSESYISSFDLGLSNDGDDWTQFVVFGGDPTGTAILSQTIDWAPETATYVDGNGDECTAGSSGCSLLVPTTQVQLEPGGDVKPVVLCSSEPGAPSSETTPHCLDSRVITEGTPLDAGEVQLTENYLFLSDPGTFR